MSLAKRLYQMVLEGWCPEEKAEEILSARESFWEGHEKGGQMLLFAQPVPDDDDGPPWGQDRKGRL